MMEKLNVLCGTTYDSSSGRDYYKQMANAYSMVIGMGGKYQVDKFEFAFSKAKLVERLESGLFNVVITDGSFTGTDATGNPVKEGIGFSSIRNWMNDYPGLKIILIEDESSKGKAKIGKLFKELSYYNIVFRLEVFKCSDLVRAVAGVINNPRTAKEALEEYGISGYGDIKEYLKANPSILGENELVMDVANEVVEESVVEAAVKEGGVVQDSTISEAPQAKENIDNNNNNNEESLQEVDFDKSTVSEETTESMDGQMVMEKSLEEKIGAFASFDFDSEPDTDSDFSETESAETEQVTEAPLTGGFDFSSVFGKDDTTATVTVVEEFAEEEPEKARGFDFNFGSGFTEAESAMREEQAVEPIEESFVKEEESMAGGTWEAVSAQVPEEQAEVMPKTMGEPDSSMISYRGFGEKRSFDSSILPAKGVIKGVVDYDAIMVEFERNVRDISFIDEYKCIVRIKGMGKGMVVNGRYKSANITFEAYVDCMVNDNTAMMDVFEFDCEEKRAFLEGKECNLIFVKM